MALWHIAMLIVVVFLTEISGAKADMVFDFQLKLAKKGNAEAQFKVGEMYETGRGVEKNVIEAKRWINKAAAQGNKAAGYNLLYKDLEKNGVTNKNKAQLTDLQKAATAGDGYAQYYLGLMYSRGVGVTKNSNSAHDWLAKASLLGITASEAEIARVNQANHGAQLRAQQEAEAQQQARRAEEERRKLEAQQRQQQAAAAKKKKAEQEQELARQREAERKAAEDKAEKQRLIAKKEAEAERKRQAVLEQRRKKEAEEQTQFVSDPCAGKSARFLSTCR